MKLRRLVASGAVVIAMTGPALGLVMFADGSSAQAFVPPPAPAISVTAKVVIPRLLAFTGPVAAVGTLGYAGWQLYSHRHDLSGWLEGLFGFGAGTSQEPSWDPFGTCAMSYGITAPTGTMLGSQSSQFVIQASIPCTALAGTGSFGNKVDYWCRSTLSGTVIQGQVGFFFTGDNGGEYTVQDFMSADGQTHTTTDGVRVKLCNGSATQQIIQVRVSHGTTDLSESRYAGGDYATWTSGTGEGLSTAVSVLCYTDDGQQAQWIDPDMQGLPPPGEQQIDWPTCAGLGPGWGGNNYVITQCPATATTLQVCKAIGTVGVGAGVSDYPLCYPGGCELHVWVDAQPCTVGNADCIDWNPKRKLAGNGGRYECHWGTYTVEITDCLPIRHLYEPGTQRYDDTPDSGTGTVAPTPTGSSTATATATATASPQPQPTGTPTGNGFPTTGTNPTSAPTGAPGTGGVAEPAPDPTASQSPDCWGSGWSWNPVSWVYIPAKCALMWAFVPPAGTVTEVMSGMGNDWASSGPGALVGGFTGMVTGVGSIGGGSGNCLGPHLVMHGMLELDAYPLSTCESPMSTVAAVLRACMVLALYLGAASVSVRAVASAFGLHLPSIGSMRSSGDEA